MKTEIAIITLNANSPEVQELLGLLAEQKLEAKIVLGVDGRDCFPTLEDGESIDRKRSLKMHQRELTKSEVGCYLSHFRTIKNAYNQGLERICLLEDDVLIEPDFAEVLSSVGKLSDEFEHIRLMGLKRHKRKKICTVGRHHQLTRPTKGLCGTQGYVINRSGMEKVLQHGHTVLIPIDKFYDHFWDIGLKSYCIEPHTILERPFIKSSIVKIPRKDIRINRLRKHFLKLYKGTKRRIYILRYWNKFFPAVKPKIPMGRTVRIR